MPTTEAAARAALTILMAVIVACADREATTHAESSASAVQDAVFLMNDANILATLGVLNDGEVATARIAQRRAARPDVRNLATALMVDHERWQRGLDSLAREAKIYPQPGPRAESLQNQARTRRERLERLTVSRFDREYVVTQVASDVDALAEVRKLAAAAHNPRVRTMILVVIPTIQSHLDSALALERRLRVLGDG